MKKEIAYIFQYKFNNIYQKRYELENLSKFFNITIYDLSKIYSPHLKKNIKRNLRSNKLFILDNLTQLKNTLKKNPPDHSFLMGDSFFILKISTLIRSIIKTKLVTFFTDNLFFLDPALNKIAIKKILFSKYFFIFFFFILKATLSKIVIFFKNKNVKKVVVDYLFYSGDKSTVNNLIDAKKKISTPSLNYTDTLEIKNKKKKLIKKKYAVFIDAFLLFHDDFKDTLGKMEKPISMIYYKEMNNFFSILEKKLKLKVVIALHPTCRIKKYKLFFNNRTCIKNETAHLVRDSELVFTHPSTTAINYPIIYNKPLVILTTHEMNKSYHYYKYLLIFKLIFKYNYLNVNSVSNNFAFPTFKIDKKAFKWHYKKFINSSNTSNKSLSDFIIKHLK